MTLTNTAIKSAKVSPGKKQQKFFDEKGLFLLVNLKGSKLWRFKYRLDGKEKQLSFGKYPDITLKQARDLRDESRALIAEGIDPSLHKQELKAQRSFELDNNLESVAREWFKKFEHTWVPSHSIRIIRRLENNIFPWLGKSPIGDISPPDLLRVLRRIEDRGAIETAHRVLSICGQVFRYAIATGRAERDISQDLKGAIPPPKKRHLPAVTEPKDVAKLLRVIDSYTGTEVVKCAMQLAPLVFVRPGELRHAKWEDINFDNAEWRFIASKTKTPHIVPLSTQSLEILEELRPITGHGIYVFPSARSRKGDRPMSDNAILAAFRRMGIEKDEMTGHGFRAMARTILDEVLGIRPDFIEHQLAHAVRDPNGRAYNRTTHLDERKKMMQDWADYLDKIKNV